MRALMLSVLLAFGCGDDEAMPLCSDVGCPGPTAPSGSDRLWTPCEGPLCYCRVFTEDSHPEVVECVLDEESR